MRGLDPQALQLSNVLLALYPNEPAALALRLRIEARHGDMRAALADFQGIEQVRTPNQVDALATASADVVMGKRCAAMRTLQNYMASGWPGLDEIDRILTDPDFDSLRNDPRFNVAVRSLTT
jgi:predicted Zn-dependent protease